MKCHFCDNPATGVFILEANAKKKRPKDVEIPVCSDCENEAGGRDVKPLRDAPIRQPPKNPTALQAGKRDGKTKSLPHKHRFIDYGKGLPRVCNICGKKEEPK